MMNDNNSNDYLDKNSFDKINQETAKVPWHELQRFFAKGDVLYVDPSEDLVKVAEHMANDDLGEVKGLMSANKLYLVTDEQAKAWHSNNEMLWTVVIKPWLLVQPINNRATH